MTEIKDIAALVTATLRVPEKLWSRALAKSGGLPLPALSLLTKTRAEWSPNDEPAMAVSEYQFQKIVSHSGPFSTLAERLVWNDYLILNELGKGGMGTVFKGWDWKEGGRYVALKRPLDANAETVRRLKREAKLLERIDHDHVARLYALEDHGGVPLVVLQYISGVDLRKTIDNRNANRIELPWPTVAKWGRELLAALGAIHAAGVVHRDVKPANIMLREEGRTLSATILDMGLGKSLSDASGMDGASVGGDLTQHAMPIGTFAYMSPEQWASGADVREGSDVYSLGVTLYEALAGRPPFTGTNMATLCKQACQDEPPPLRARRPDIPEGFAKIVHRMMEKDPAARGSARQLAEKFQRALDPGAPVAAVPSAPLPTPIARSPTPRVSPTRPLPEEPPVPLVVTREGPSGSFAVVALCVQYLRLRHRLLAGPPDREPVALFERRTRMDLVRTGRDLRAGLQDRAKMLVHPHRAPLEWLGILAIIALFWWLFRSR